MATIKEMIVEKLRQQKRDTADYIVSGKIKQYLKEICLRLPDETPAGQEFVKIINSIQDEWHDKAVNTLVEKAMNVRDDLKGDDYRSLRQKLVAAINSGR